MTDTPRAEPVTRTTRAGAVSGLIAAVLLLADLVTLSATPSVASPAGDIVSYLRDNRTLMLVMSYAGALTAVTLTPFLASFERFVDRNRPDERWRWTVAAVSGGVAIAVLVVGNGLRAAATVLANERGDGAAALFDTAKVTLSFSLVPIAAFVASASRLMSTTRLTVRWALQFGPFLAILCVVSGLLVFADDSVFGPGEIYLGFVGVLLALWIAASAIAMLEGES